MVGPRIFWAVPCREAGRHRVQLDLEGFSGKAGRPILLRQLPVMAPELEFMMRLKGGQQGNKETMERANAIVGHRWQVNK